MAEHNERPPLVVAFAWISKITTVALEMVLPGIIGTWLDRRWGTKFLALAGFALGLSVSIWHLLVLTGTENSKPTKRPDSENPNKDDRA